MTPYSLVDTEVEALLPANRGSRFLWMLAPKPNYTL